jgi:GcrA cell cycle regulator
MVQTLERGRRAGEVMEEAGAMTWTEDRLEELKQVWVEEALTSTQIAEPSGDAEKLEAPREPVSSQAPLPLPTAPSAADISMMESHASSRIGTHPTIFELRAGQCRFPLGGSREPAVFFCGKPAEALRPYCRECCQRAYTARKPRS